MRRSGKSTAAALLLAATVVATLAACASAPAGSAAAGGDGAQGAAATAPAATQPGDPWENWNRKVFVFNDAVDEAVVKPVAQTYRRVVPEAVRTGIGNVLGNLGDVWSTVNQFLQGKVGTGLEMGMRVLSNTFFGLGGLLDPATEMGLTRRSEDFGQTLGRWGVGAGPYVVLPLLGPSTLRDTFALPADLWASPSSLPSQTAGKVAVTGVALVDTRSNLLSTTQLLDDVALDRYSFVRDAYLSRRLDQVYDGAPPMEKFEDEPADAAAALPAAGAPAVGAARPGQPASAAEPSAKPAAPSAARPAPAASAPR